MLDSLQPLQSESTAGVIAGRIREAIMSGVLKPGTQLGEVDVATSLKVSRGPVREALQRLVQEGVLVAVRNRGVFVPEFGPEDVVDVYLMRRAIEGAAASLLIARGSTGLERLEAVLRRMNVAAKGKRWAAVADRDAEFHQELVRATNSPRLERMLGTLIVESRLCMAALENTYRASAELVEEHRQLFDAIKRGDEAETAVLIRHHMNDAADRLTELHAARAVALGLRDGTLADSATHSAINDTLISRATINRPRTAKKFVTLDKITDGMNVVDNPT